METFQDTFTMYDYYADLEAETLNDFLEFKGAEAETAFAEYKSAHFLRRKFERLLDKFLN